jgi:hypothetical protein
MNNTLPNLTALLASATPGPLEFSSSIRRFYTVTLAADGGPICSYERGFDAALANAKLHCVSANNLPKLAKALVEYNAATIAVINAANSGDLAEIASAADILSIVANEARAALAALEEDCK